MDETSKRIGVVYWNEEDGLASLHSDDLAYLGYQPVKFLHNAKIPPDLEVVIAGGPFGSLVPLANQLAQIPPAHRPAFALTLNEQLPNPELPEWLRYGVGTIRSRAERLIYRRDDSGAWRPIPRLRWLTTKAYRYRYYGDLFWLRRAGVLSALAVWSFWTADFLRARGFDPVVLPQGHHPEWGRNLGLERDIPVLWLGKIATARRRRLLQRIRADLNARGIEMMVVDGEEHPYIFGEERTVLLNRTKIVVNLLREKWDSNSLRYALAAHNGALVVTEPTLPHSRFIPGEHIVAAPIEQMAETICYYLEHEEERRRIAAQAHQMRVANAVRGAGMAEILEKALAHKR